MRLVNIIPFFNEELHLSLRLKMCYDKFDEFIICEADRTHSGELKSFTLEHSLKKITKDKKGKIKVVKINLPSKQENDNNWVRENLQRDVMTKFLLEDDIVISTDCDEFVNPIYIDAIKEHVMNNTDSILKLPMTMHYSRADLILCNNHTEASFACSAKILKKIQPSKIREAIAYNTSLPYSYSYLDGQNLTGWHFSWMGKPEERLIKMSSFAHSEDEITHGIGKLRSQDAIDRVKNYIPLVGSVDPLGRSDHRLCPYSIDNLPIEIMEDKKLSDYYLPKISSIIYE